MTTAQPMSYWHGWTVDTPGADGTEVRYKLWAPNPDAGRDEWQASWVRSTVGPNADDIDCDDSTGMEPLAAIAHWPAPVVAAFIEAINKENQP